MKPKETRQQIERQLIGVIQGSLRQVSQVYELLQHWDLLDLEELAKHRTALATALASLHELHDLLENPEDEGPET